MITDRYKNYSNRDNLGLFLQDTFQMDLNASLELRRTQRITGIVSSLSSTFWVTSSLFS
jgi:hypothetical protein